MARRSRLSEHQEQSTFVDYVLFAYMHDPTFRRRLFFAVPNGAVLKRKGRDANLLKREGMTNGVADICYLQPRGPYNALAIEMKVPGREGEKNGGLSDEQLEFKEQAAEVGICVDTCYGADHAIQVFDTYMRLEVVDYDRNRHAHRPAQESGPAVGEAEQAEEPNAEPSPAVAGHRRPKGRGPKDSEPGQGAA